MLSVVMPRFCSSMIVKRIMISGPQIMATVLAGSNCTLGIRVVTTPTLPNQPRSAVSTVTAEVEVGPVSPARELVGVEEVVGGARPVEQIYAPYRLRSARME